MLKFRLLIAMFFLGTGLFAQNSLSTDHALNWASAPTIVQTPGGNLLEVWTFDDCSRSDMAPELPLFSKRIALDGPANVEASLKNTRFERISLKAAPEALALIGDELQASVSIEQERNRFFARVRFFPLRKNGASFERLTAFTLELRITPQPVKAADRGGPNTYNSVLSTGDIYKFGVNNSGVYRLDYNFLKNELGISNLDNIDPRKIRLYGNGGMMLSEQVSDPRPDDLLENAIQIVGEQDGKFDASDFILFYATGPNPVLHRPDNNSPELTVRNHLYDTHAWYFIKIGEGTGLRIQDQPSVSASYVTDAFDDVQRLEEEEVNLLNFNSSSQGSGKRWFGDYFAQIRQRNYAFTFPGAVVGTTARFRAEFAGRCGTATTVRINVAGTQSARNINPVPVSNNESSFAANALLIGNFTVEGDQIPVVIDYPNVAQSSEGWLDYIELNVRRQLVIGAQPLVFRDLQSRGQGSALYRISGVNGALSVWDVTLPAAPGAITPSGGNTAEFGAPADTLRTFVAFYPNNSLPKPEVASGRIENQNIHGIDNRHMVILYHPDFQSAAERLAEHRRTYSQLDVATVNILQLYNEFSSGSKDITAIRDFARMLLDRNPEKFEYLLLFGDGSFDPKNNSQSNINQDFIPVFETQESYHPIFAYPSDDYFALLSDGEGSALDGALDIAVGRITVSTLQEADAVVDKIIEYDNSPKTLGDWHLKLLYMADDEDGNAHINQAEKLANAAEDTEDWFNTEKVYFDAYQQVATTADDRIPGAKAAINSNIFKGVLIAQYIGHGGPRGWAQERVIENNDIAGWNNKDRYPLIITATCSFGGYDDYNTLTGGEQSLIKANSGAVALFTTVRAVYIDGNNKLTDAVQRVIFQRINGQYRTIGDILKDAKNTLTGGTEDNARRFTLLGDPAMYLALPEYRVVTTSINGNPVQPGQPDTLKALMPVELEGMVTDTFGNALTNFNGIVYVTLFDKKQTLQTLGQDPGSIIRTFTLQRNVLFKGRATVANGAFRINFVVPKDINYALGAGKISYYAENGTPFDAAGADENIIIGGNANAIQDDQPPLIQVFMNTDNFVPGGITDKNPTILVKCSDNYGMNVTGVSLGHDLTAILDDNQLEAIVLNDFYESEKDDFRKGSALYPLNNLSTGPHTLKVKGWDIANNAGEGFTEFIVSEDGKVALEQVLNYPNPFTTQTFFQFEHNLAGQLLDIQISIFSVSGKLVKTILHTTTAEGFRVSDISWDGRDEYGDQLARGVYLYRVKVRGTDVSGNNAQAESDFEKLVILK